MIQILYLTFSILAGMSCKYNQIIDVKMLPVASLPSQLPESSGMVMLKEDLYVGNNDSGNPAELHLFSILRKSATRTVTITDAVNRDWEELAADEEFVYIGDTGNNNGSRKNLAIYRVKKNELLVQNEVAAEKISYFYPEQESFAGSNKHNFDCEAMICVGDSLYLFTKNRGDQYTDVYSLSKTPGEYAARHRGRYNAQGLVTGADFRSTDSGNELVLVGYQDKDQGYHPFLLYFTQIRNTDFFNLPVQRITFTGTLQTETVLFYDDHSVYVTNEEEHGDEGFVFQVKIRN